MRVGKIGGKFVLNPSLAEVKESELDLIVAAAENGIIMVEGGASFISEDDAVAALSFAEESVKGVLALQEKIYAECGLPKLIVEKHGIDAALEAKIKDFSSVKLKAALSIPAKAERYDKMAQVKDELLKALLPEYPEKEKTIKVVFSDLKYDIMRRMVLDENRRVDGRSLKDIREITCEVGLCRGRTARRFSRGAKLSPWSLRRSAPRKTSRR